MPIVVGVGLLGGWVDVCLGGGVRGWWDGGGGEASGGCTYKEVRE